MYIGIDDQNMGCFVFFYKLQCGDGEVVEYIVVGIGIGYCMMVIVCCVCGIVVFESQFCCQSGIVGVDLCMVGNVGCDGKIDVMFDSWVNVSVQYGVDIGGIVCCFDLVVWYWFGLVFGQNVFGMQDVYDCCIFVEMMCIFVCVCDIIGVVDDVEYEYL